jgi:hypothetical protein
MHWTYEDVRALPVDVYGVLMEMLTAQQQARD